jgi:hypothetical protein
MNTNLALLLLLAPFIGFLFNVFFGKSENQLLGSLEPCVSFGSAFSLGNNTIRVHFRLDSNQQFQGVILVSIRPIIHFMVTVCNRNWFVNSYVLYQLHA